MAFGLKPIANPAFISPQGVFAHPPGGGITSPLLIVSTDPSKGPANVHPFVGVHWRVSWRPTFANGEFLL